MSRTLHAIAIAMAFLFGCGGITQAVRAAERVKSASQKAPRNLIIDQIEIIGVRALTQSDLEGMLVSGVGDYLEESKVSKTAANIRELYRSRGYHQAGVRSEFYSRPTVGGARENILRFIVNEGKPTRIASVKLSPERIGNPSLKEFWKKIEPKLLERLGTAPGDIFDQEKVAAGAKEIQAILASEEFVGATVRNIEVRNVPKPSSLESVTDSDRWMSLEIHVDLGDRISFGFRGNEFFTRSQLTSLIQDQKVLGFGKDYVMAIKSRIEEEYRANGYAQVRVRYYVFEQPTRQERHVTYIIDEDSRFRIEKVEFDGNIAFSKGQLLDFFRSEAPASIQAGYYAEKGVEKTAEAVVQRIKSQGYLSAKLITVNKSLDVNRKTARLTIYLYEGEQTIVRSIRVNGVTEFTPEEVQRMLSLQFGQPLNLYAFGEGLDALKAAYRDRGYLNMVVVNEGTDTVVTYSQENRAADVRVDVVEGYKYKVSRIAIEGRGMTSERVISRELVFSPDDSIGQGKINESEARLRKLGIFSSVHIRADDDPDKPGYKVVTVSVQEGTPGVVAGGLGLRNDLGFRAFGQTSYSNVLGVNHALFLNVAGNRRFEERRIPVEYQTRLGYVWPWFGFDEVTFRPTISVEKTQYRQFDAFSMAFSATLDRKILEKPNLLGALTYSLERVQQTNAHDEFGNLDKIDNQTLKIGSVTPSLRLDMRDDPLAPTSGFYSSASYEIAAPMFYSQVRPFPVGYTRFQFRSDYFVPISRSIVGYFSFRTGFERNLHKSDDSRVGIPLIKQFALGGVGSLRGFKEQELNLQKVQIRGTASYVNYRFQLDLPFAGALRFGPFLDAANLLVDRYSLGQLRYGTGAGFHYQTPVGPVNFDLGFKIDPKPGEDPYQFYFSIGII